MSAATEGVAGQPSSSPPPAAVATEAPLTLAQFVLAVDAERRRRAVMGSPTALPQQQQPLPHQPPPPPQQPGPVLAAVRRVLVFRDDARRVLGDVFSWSMLLRIVFGAFFFTGTLSLKSVLMATAAYFAFAMVKFLLASVRLRRGPGAGAGANAAPQGPTALGSYFLRFRAGAPGEGPLPWGARVGYKVAKCTEALFLSISPFYSLENLELELVRDGIAVQVAGVAAPSPDQAPEGAHEMATEDGAAPEEDDVPPPAAEAVDEERAQ